MIKKIICAFHLSLCFSLPADRFSYIVVEGRTGKILDAHHANRPQQPASLTKKMTLRLLFEALKSKKITLSTKFFVSALAQKQMPSRLDLKKGEWVSVESLIKGLVTKSANDGCIVVAENLAGSVDKFVKLMNKRAHQLGMKHTVFHNPSGVPNNKQQSTAYDMVLLAQSLYRDFPQYFHYFKTKGFQFRNKHYKNHNKLLGKIDGLDGMKTGYVEKAGFCITTSTSRIVKGKKVRLFVVVLGGKTAKSRDFKTIELIENNYAKIGYTAQCSYKMKKHDPVDQALSDIDTLPVGWSKPKMSSSHAA